MTNSKKIGNEIYQNLGRIFYAVAISDKRIHNKEIDILKKLIREKWLDVDEIEDEYGTDAAFQIETVFDWLQEYEQDGETCYKEFLSFYKEHENIFTPEIKELILHTSHSIAMAFSGKNKSELVMLGNLKILFNK